MGWKFAQSATQEKRHPPCMRDAVAEGIGGANKLIVLLKQRFHLRFKHPRSSQRQLLKCQRTGANLRPSWHPRLMRVPEDVRHGAVEEGALLPPEARHQCLLGRHKGQHHHALQHLLHDAKAIVAITAGPRKCIWGGGGCAWQVMGR